MTISIVDYTKKKTLVIYTLQEFFEFCGPDDVIPLRTTAHEILITKLEGSYCCKRDAKISLPFCGGR